MNYYWLDNCNSEVVAKSRSKENLQNTTRYVNSNSFHIFFGFSSVWKSRSTSDNSRSHIYHKVLKDSAKLQKRILRLVICLIYQRRYTAWAIEDILYWESKSLDPRLPTNLLHLLLFPTPSSPRTIRQG